jgi:16S rRNA processing protein RimM
MSQPRRILVAAVTGAHGVSGRVKLKCFTETPEAVGDYGDLADEAGERRFAVRVTGAAKGGVIAELSDVRDRNAAEALKGARLYADRDRLPELDDEEDYYHADLIGLAAVTAEGRTVGRVRAIHDFGAGDVLDIRSARGNGVMLPFTADCVPEIDIEGGRMTVAVPDEVEVHDTSGEG